MKSLKNLLDRLFNSIDETELGASHYLEEVELKLHTDEQYNLKACETLIQINTMFTA